jgi:hypothetical protein
LGSSTTAKVIHLLHIQQEKDWRNNLTWSDVVAAEVGKSLKGYSFRLKGDSGQGMNSSYAQKLIPVCEDVEEEAVEEPTLSKWELQESPGRELDE